MSTGFGPSDLLLKLLDLRLQIEQLIQDLSMVAQVLDQQSTCVDNFVRMAASFSGGIHEDKTLSSDLIETQLLKSRISSHISEAKSIADTASGVHRTVSCATTVSLCLDLATGSFKILGLLQNEQLRVDSFKGFRTAHP